MSLASPKIRLAVGPNLLNGGAALYRFFDRSGSVNGAGTPVWPALPVAREGGLRWYSCRGPSPVARVHQVPGRALSSKLVER